MEVPDAITSPGGSTVRRRRLGSNEVGTQDTRSDQPLEDRSDADSVPPSLVFREGLYYPMSKRPRGLFVIFNHEEFKCANTRVGTDVDKQNLERAWGKLGFQVVTHTNLTKNEVESEIEKYSSMDHSQYDCFACAFLSHGNECGEIYAYDGKHSLQDAILPFQENASLRRKPKLFFIQACRGTAMDEGKMLQCDSLPNEEEECEFQFMTLPSHADILIAYSTVDGHYAWRNEQHGSWFIQKLTQCIERYHREHDLMRILTLVNREVGVYESSTKDKRTRGKKQSPSVVTQLTAIVHFGMDHQPPTEYSARKAVEERTESVFDSAGMSRKDKYYQLKMKSLKKQNDMNEMKRRKYQIEIVFLLCLLLFACVFVFIATRTKLFTS